MPEFPDFDQQYYDDWAAELHEQHVADYRRDGIEPCGCLSNSTNAHRASCPDYLGEVPWSDRVDE